MNSLIAGMDNVISPTTTFPIVPGLSGLIDKSNWGTLMYLRNQMFAISFLLACVQILDFLSFHHLFGPWAIIIGDLMKDLARFLAVLGIFVFGFSMHIVALNQPFKQDWYPEKNYGDPELFSEGKELAIPSGINSIVVRYPHTHILNDPFFSTFYFMLNVQALDLTKGTNKFLF